MKRVVVHATKRVFDGFLKIDEAELSWERRDGRMSARVRRLCVERGDSVAAVVYDRDSQRAVFVTQFRYPTYGKGPGWIMEIVAGMLEAGETPESALRREVLEETGYRVEALEPIATFYLSPGGSSERILLYYAEVTEGGRTGAGAQGDEEDAEAVFLSLEDLERLLATGAIHDAKTIVGIQWLLRRFG